MASEQALLVRSRSDSEGSAKLTGFGAIARPMAYTDDRINNTEGSGEPNHPADPARSPPDLADSTESGELLDYNDASVLEQFHEDALRQAGCGLAQIRVVLAAGLAVVGAAVELAAIPFILPSAEIELCILPHEKDWLVRISLVGSSLGAVGWGALGERLGRRRALLSCLAVNAVFAAIAAVMPTYGTFMMARFCSAIGSGGILPTCYTYCGESCSRSWRFSALCALLACGAIGALLAAAGAGAILPPTGPTTLYENKEHFSAWHRYLLLCMLPILASLISLIWTQESPRYLLDMGREVDAMMVYQNIHSSNQIKLCGKASVGTNPEAEYRLGELALPGKRRPPALHHVRHSVKMFWQAFFQLFSNSFRKTTLSLGGTLLFAMAIQYYLSSYIPASILKLESNQFAAGKKVIENETITNVNYNTTLENVQFVYVQFNNCTFRDMLMSHVSFNNCSFRSVALSNIQTSYTSFEHTAFFNTTIIDTDIEVDRELISCTFLGTTIRGMRGSCGRRADLAWRLRGLLAYTTYGAHAALLAAIAVLLPKVARPTMAVCAACVLLSPLLYVARSEPLLLAAECAYRLLITMVFYAVSVHVIEAYPANLRCTAHGLILSVTYMGGAIVRGFGHGGPSASCIVCGLFAIAATSLATRIR